MREYTLFSSGAPGHVVNRPSYGLVGKKSKIPSQNETDEVDDNIQSNNQNEELVGVDNESVNEIVKNEKPKDKLFI